MRRSSFFVRILSLAAVVLAAPGCGLERSGITDGASGDGRDADGIGPHICGNGRVELPEECDDGNTILGDGCEPDCIFSCHDDSECDDGNQCTEDMCSYVGTGRDCSNRVVIGLDCDDGNPCTYIDATSHDSCEGDPPICVSGPNHCQCTTTGDCTPYNPENRCDGTLVCAGNVCDIDPATIVVCDPSGDTDCRIAFCDPGTGTCGPLNRPDGIACDDGSWCSLTEDCRGGVCTQRTPQCAPEACVSCNEVGGSCDPISGWCAIDGACVQEGIKNPANPCQACQPSVDPWSYTNLSAGADCDDGSYCNGPETCDSAGTCRPGTPPCPVVGCVGGCDDGSNTCTPSGSSTRCRDSTGPCDPAENCTGSSTDCPPDELSGVGTVCNPSRGDCDVAETCDGTTASCPTDVVRPGSFECRAAAGACDVAETCGTSTTVCPANVTRPGSFECRAAAGACDVAETCGTSTTVCPADVTRPGTFECRPSRGACDPAETCGASITTCPADVTGPSGFVCRSSTRACDPAETCGSSTSGCPADVLVVDGAVCPGIPTGVCCTGTCHDPGDCCSSTDCTDGNVGFSCSSNNCICSAEGRPCTGTERCCPSGGGHPGQCRTSAC